MTAATRTTPAQTGRDHPGKLFRVLPGTPPQTCGRESWCVRDCDCWFSKVAVAGVVVQ